jgi:DNA-binding transcriptional LysR family regulator
VAPTEAGERLIATLRLALSEIDAKLAVLSELRQKPAATVRITTNRYAAESILWPALKPLLESFPGSANTSFSSLLMSNSPAVRCSSAGARSASVV